MTDSSATISSADLHGVWQVDAQASSIELGVRFLTILTTRCNVRAVGGTIDVGADRLNADVEIDASSFESGNRKRDDHVRSADFLDCDQHPILNVVINETLTDHQPAMAQTEARAMTGVVTRGSLLVPVDLTLTDLDLDLDAGRLRATVDAEIDRRALGVPKMPGLLIGNTVRVRADIVARKNNPS